tara:strand:- start:525 stop:1001 length:477 start_codon:yes stop_codon:yes gene_type:complete
MEVILPEETKQPKKPTDEKKKGVLNKLQEITPDKDEQVALIGVAVRLGIVVWSGFILTLAYVDLPGFQKQNFDPTFIASVFTGALSTFGLATSKDKSKGNGVSKEELEAMMTKNNQSATEQVIRVQTPLTINGAEVVQQERIDPITQSTTGDDGKLKP